MYLKSLVLKGFKSFADRMALVMEPGITAIVGPNGSGKSNISDAVLWVLGERNARNLRGQAMEDIIFSGSAARKAVSVAEVDLVLDNSDGTLPVEFDEVVITRRMFRSGESEYLVNGVVSRRLDVLDILHDTGLGTGTHSIISQGSLDSILQSKPEDRRALIEEAAGILKHKQRKAKSARKLEAMDGHLVRVRDIAGEVSRQLGPLERKAKRAAAYREAKAELGELRLALAVDDLRKLQVEWEAVCAAEREASEKVESLRAGMSSAEQKVNDLQELIRRESEDAGELSRRHRRAASLAERLDSAEMLLRERRRSVVGYEADLQATLADAAEKKATAQSELSAAKSQLDEVVALCAASDAQVTELEESRVNIEARKIAAEKEVSRLWKAVRSCEAEIDDAKRNQAFLQETLSNGMAHVKVVQARKAELEGELGRVRAEYEQCASASAGAKEALASLEAQSSEAQVSVATCFEAREGARVAREQADEAVRLLESEIKAIEQAQRAVREGAPALAWLMDNASDFDGVLVSQVVKASKGIELLVEHLLGEDLAALAVGDSDKASEIAGSLLGKHLAGDVTLIAPGSAAAGNRSVPARESKEGKPLVAELAYSRESAPVVEALLGDVVLCADRSQAFAAHKRDALGLRFVSPDGCAIWPEGRVRIYGAGEAEGEGVLARERRLDALRARLVDALAARDGAVLASDSADEAYREAQAASLKVGQDLTYAKGAYSSAVADEDRAKRKLSTVVVESEDLDRQVAAAQSSVDDVRPKLYACAELIAEQERKSAEYAKEHDARAGAAAPLRDESERLAERLADAKLKAATYAERRTYAERIVSARQRDIDSTADVEEDANRLLAAKAVAAKRGEELLAVLATLSRGLARRAQLLDEALAASQTATGTVHADAAAARDAARKARDDYDEAGESAAQVRVRKSRLEVQVETAVNVVTVDLQTPLDKADKLEPLVDRTTAEDDALRLERRIKSMGSINPDAAEEYAELKERYDFLAGQLSDMEAARRSLARITNVIDRRMKDDFARTFEEVNANFNEIFDVLFPGGQAHLSLEDPDDVETSGVEVTAQPRGKRITKMMLMSGGEKSLTALALLFAVYKTRATPFYILDEVEAALDDTNLRRLTAYIDTLRKSTQLIMITHQRRTMEMADVLFGVSMQSDGVTQVISQKLERALELAE